MLPNEDGETETYEIVRFREHGASEVLKTGVTLEEAKEHCDRDDTHGEGWFDGWRAE